MVGVALAGIVSAVLCFAASRLGPALGYIDHPDDPSLKAHTQPAVPLGGVAIFSAVHIGLAANGSFSAWLFAASLVLLVLGLVDDRVGLAPLTRLGVEVIAGGILATEVAGDRGWAAGSLVGILVVVAVNAVNLFDGLDGLAGSAALVTALGGAALAATRDVSNPLGLIVAAALVGFLVLNWHPAKVFLGDNGAYSVALFLVAVIVGTGDGSHGEALLEIGIGAGLLGVFLVDLASTVLRRFLARQPLFAGDRNHVYDRLHARGLSVPAVAASTALAQALFVGVAVAIAIWTGAGWGTLIVAGLGLASVAALAVGPWLPLSEP